MARPTRTVTVDHTRQLSPNMLRISVSGPSLTDFPGGFEGGYIKLALAGGERPAVRSYTIREFDGSTLVFDVVAHGDKGPAARWASQVSAGDSIDILGPGACKRINAEADWFLLAGDMTAIPAISVNLENLPAEATGHLVLEVIDEADRIDLPVPTNMTVTWLINPHPEMPGSTLADTVAALPWQPGQAAAWVAGEFSASRQLRKYLRHDRQLDKEHLYLSCYWKIGDTDEGMKAAKKADSESW